MGHTGALNETMPMTSLHARLYAEHGVPVVMYGAGPRTVHESRAKQADEHVRLDDLRGATKVVSSMLADFLAA